MSVKPREGSPYLWYDFTVERVRFRGSTGETGKAEARKVEHAKRSEALKQPHAAGNWKLRYVLGAYWNEHAIALPSAKTIEYQLAELSKIIGPDQLANKITAAMLIAYRTRRRAEGLSDASINREFVILRAALNYVSKIHGQHPPAIPWGDLKVKEPPGRSRFLGFDDFERLLAAAHPSLRPILMCAVTTGLRKENILALDWRQVKLDERIMQMVTKGGKDHSVRIVPQLMAALSTIDPKKRRGRVFDRCNFEKRWRAALLAAGIEAFRFHDLRHTFASWARQNGADIADVCEALAHSDISVTMRYAHIKPDAENTAFDRVSAALSAQSPSHRQVKGLN